MSEPSSDEDFAAMFAQHEARRTLEIGQMVKGRVIQISDEHVFVDVGGKGEAWIDPAELADDEGRLKVKVGDEIEATVVATGDEIRLSHRLRQGAQAREALAVETRKKILPDAVLPGTVVSLADFGAFVDLGGVQGLVPMSELSHARVERAGDRLRVGEPVTVKVLRIDEAKGRVTLSLKALEGDPWVAVPG